MDKFSIEESNGCKFDYIQLRDGPFGYSKFIAQFCGEGFPVTIQTKSRFLWARFTSDDLVNYDGFKAVYEFKIDESKWFKLLDFIIIFFRIIQKSIQLYKMEQTSSSVIFLWYKYIHTKK